MRKIGLYKKRKMSAKRIKEKNKALALLSKLNNALINYMQMIKQKPIPNFPKRCIE
jgi:hypothetical protein